MTAAGTRRIAAAFAAAALLTAGCRSGDAPAETEATLAATESDTQTSAAVSETEIETTESQTGETSPETTAESAAVALTPAWEFAPTDESRWANAVDGMILETVTGKTFKGYVLLIRDPSRVSVAIKDKSFESADRIYQIVEQYGAVAAINGGEFPDTGTATEPTPIGLTYSQGECVWDDGTLHTFMGFTADNRLIVEEGTTREEADALGIRDAVAFQSWNTLISSSGGKVTYHYSGYTEGISQRTAIGQLADGTVIFLVTDGRTAASLGASRNEIIDILASYGTVTAGMLDGGASSLLWYRDWSTKYGANPVELDSWQQGGLVNIFKAFTYPRSMPTFFIVAPDATGASYRAPDSVTDTSVIVPDGWSVTVDGVALGDEFIAERGITAAEADELPAGVYAPTYVRYALSGAPDTHSVTVADSAGNSAYVSYIESERAYRAYPTDASLKEKYSAYVVEAMSSFAKLMSADCSWEVASEYFDPEGSAYGKTDLAAKFTWTVLSHDGASITSSEASRFIRYSDDVFSCRVRLTNTLTKGGGVFNDRIDWTVVFRNVGGKWLIYALVYNP